MIKWNKMINDMGTFGVNDMNLNQLYYFRTLAELEHYTKAAEKLTSAIWTAYSAVALCPSISERTSST